MRPKEKSEWNDLAAQIEALIRAGQKAQAVHHMAALQPNSIPRPFRFGFARLCRRANAPQLGIRFLASLIHPTKKEQFEPTVDETAEYAVCLIRIGAVAEGLGLLSPLSVKDSANVALYRAFAHIAQWDYAASIEDLEGYLSSSQPTEYERLVAKANLLAAYIAERQEKTADSLYRELAQATDSAPTKLLHGSVLELGARHALAHHRFEEARQRIEQVEKHFAGTADIHLFYAGKLTVLESVLREGASKASHERIEALRKESQRRHHWETLRECDRIEAKATGDQRLFDRVYLGTPHAAYRKSLLTEFGNRFSIPQSFAWACGEGGKAPKRWLDVASGRCDDEKIQLKPGQLLHRFLAALASDFYKPHRIASLHALLFPAEYYNPFTSPGRVHRTLGRWRAFSIEQRLNLDVHEVDEMYQMLGNGSTGIRVENTDSRLLSAHAINLRRLRDTFAGRPFSITEATLALGGSRSATQRVLSQLAGEKLISASGSARATRYRFN